MAARWRAPRCLELKCNTSRPSTASPLATTSSLSVRINSMWQGFDMYGLI